MRLTTTYRKDVFQQVTGARIRERRKAAGLSKSTLAKMCAVGESSIDAAEMGMGCSWMLAALIAHHLDLTMDDLTPLDAVVVDDGSTQAAE